MKPRGNENGGENVNQGVLAIDIDKLADQGPKGRGEGGRGYVIEAPKTFKIS